MADQDIFTGVHEVTVDRIDHVDNEGLVMRWRRRGDVWEGLVSHEVDGKITTEWLPALVLTPMSSL